MKSAIFSIIILIFFVSFSTAYAQFDVLNSDINISISPENPGPNQEVSVSLTSYSTDINNANITWRVNGKVEKQGRGAKSFNFTTGSFNTITTLGVTIVTADGDTITKNISIKPAEIDLIWESDGIVPPFYKGKSLFVHQNKITFTAIPHITSSNGNEISSGNLIYTWKNNGTVLDGYSGYGKNSMTLVGSIISRPLNIEVIATYPATGATASRSVYVEPTEPSIIFYKRNPLYGIEFQNALTGVVSLSNTKEVSVVGIPLFFSANGLNDQNIDYNWKINGNNIQNGGLWSQTFRQVDETTGISNISLKISHANKILEYTTNNFNLLFVNQSQNSDNPTF